MTRRPPSVPPDPDTDRGRRRVRADLNRMLRADAAVLVRRLLRTSAVRDRPAIGRMLRRGEYAAAGRAIQRLEADGRNGSSEAAAVAEKFGRALDALRERADYRLDAAPVVEVAEYGAGAASSRPKGRARSGERDWAWVDVVSRDLLRSVVGPRDPRMVEAERKRARALGAPSRDVLFVVDTLEGVERTVREALLAFDGRLLKLKAGRAMSDSEVRELLVRSAPSADDLPAVWVEGLRTDTVRRAILSSREATATRRRAYAANEGRAYLIRMSTSRSVPPVLERSFSAHLKATVAALATVGSVT